MQKPGFVRACRVNEKRTCPEKRNRPAGFTDHKERQFGKKKAQEKQKRRRNKVTNMKKQGGNPAGGRFPPCFSVFFRHKTEC